MDYLDRAGLIEPSRARLLPRRLRLHDLHRQLGPLLDGVTEAVNDDDLSVVSVLSGNRNFEGRIHPDVRMNYLASPPWWWPTPWPARWTSTSPPAPGPRAEGNPVFLADMWPSIDEVSETIRASLTSDMFRTRYGAVFDGDEYWQQAPRPRARPTPGRPSTYVRNPPYFDGMTMTPEPVTDIAGARVLAMLGDSVTTDHISPAGSIGPTTPAGR